MKNIDKNNHIFIDNDSLYKPPSIIHEQRVHIHMQKQKKPLDKYLPLLFLSQGQ